MPELIHERRLKLVDPEGTMYERAVVYAELQPAGTWAAWVEFLPQNGEKVLQTDRETTQSTMAAVVYWASGLQPTYFEGALDRAFRRTPDPQGRRARTSPLTAGGVVKFCLRTSDPEVPFRVMATRTLMPGVRRQIHNGGVIVYRRAREPALRHMPVVYEFVAQFGSTDGAAILADRLSQDLKGTGAIFEVGKDEVRLEAGAILQAFLAAV